MRALIVDDSPVMRKVVERALRQAGMDFTAVLQAGNGAEALQCLRTETAPIAIILSDINMPIMDGLEFLEARRQEQLAPGVPVVMITTEGAEPLVLRALAAGAQGYICKPFTADQVKARVLPLLALTTPSSLAANPLMPGSRVTVQQELLKHLDEAVAEVFALMLSRQCSPHNACECELGMPDLTALVRFSGSLKGACAVRLDTAFAGELAYELTGECVSETSQLPADTVAELCNMIAGSWKSRLAPALAACKLSVPEMHAARPPSDPTPDTMLTRYYHFAEHCLTLELTLA